MTTSTEREHRATARDLGLLARYVRGRVLRRWYLAQLEKHHLISAASEVKLAQQHADAAHWFVDLACAARAELRQIEGAK